MSSAQDIKEGEEESGAGGVLLSSLSILRGGQGGNRCHLRAWQGGIFVRDNAISH